MIVGDKIWNVFYPKISLWVCHKYR